MEEYNARDVLDRYINALRASRDRLVRDIDELGYPKDIVKFVLQHCIRAMDSAEQRQFLKGAYLSLAGFQPLSPEQREAARRLNEMWPGADAEQSGSDGEMHRLGEAAAPLEAVIGQIRNETIVLTQELKSLSGERGAPA